MKINEVEAQVGITKRNIRFYEKEGLLTPGRNSDNGYRDYGEEDVAALRKIKLLRKLDLPIEEIRRLQSGTLTLSDAARRHIIVLERQRENLSTMQALCTALEESGAQFSTMDTDAYLARMEQMEEEGTRFVNIKKQDTIAKYVGPVIAALVTVAAMGGFIGLLLWAFAVDPNNAPPLGLAVFLCAIPGVVIVGVLLALAQRFKEIRGGEEDAASKY